jgi:transposase
MMGEPKPQQNFFHAITLEQLVPEHHPFRKIRPLIDTQRIRELCKPYYCENNGRPSIPPEQLFLAWLGGYLLGCRSDRKLVMELQCNMAFRWFVGLDIDSQVWDDTTFSRNRSERFEGTDIFEKLFDETVKVAARNGWVSDHWSIDGTLVRANASQKSFVPIEVHQSPEQYREIISGKKKSERTKGRDDDPGNPTVRWDGQKRSNKTHRSKTDPDARLGRKGNGEGAQPCYTVNGVMENRKRILVGIGVETFQGPVAETVGALKLIDRARKRYRLRPRSVGGDKGFFAAKFLGELVGRGIRPHVAALEKGTQDIHRRIRAMSKTVGYMLSQRARKKIEELWGEGKEFHCLRRFSRRGLEKVRQEAHLIGWLLNLKRLSALQAAATA